MGGRRALVVAAAATMCLGIVAAVTRTGWMALAGGTSAVVTAVLAVRSTPVPVRSARRVRPARASVVPAPVETMGSPPGDDDGSPALATVADRPRLLDESMLPAVLEGRVAMARRALRPVSLLLLEVLELDERGNPAGRTDLVEQLLGSTFRESDVCGCRRDGVYVFILEDTSEDGAIWTAERFRRTLGGVRDGLRFCAGIAAYPNHGLEAEAVLAKAELALRAAREWQRDRIEVAGGP